MFVRIYNKGLCSGLDIIFILKYNVKKEASGRRKGYGSKVRTRSLKSVRFL